MSNFIHAIFNYQFMQNALFSIITASALCGLIGTFVVNKKITMMSGSIAHAILGGIGIANFLGLNLYIGAFIFALFSAIVIGLVTLKQSSISDSVISSFWAIGMAIGIIFINFTPGYTVDLMSYLFGNLLLVDSQSLYILIGVTIVSIILISVFYNKIVAICFDQEYARISGINVTFYYLLLMILIAVSIVALQKVVGIIMVVALLSLPSTIAKFYSVNTRQMILKSIAFSMFFMLLGFFMSYILTIPPGATIIVVTGAAFFVNHLIMKLLKQ